MLDIGPRVVPKAPGEDAALAARRQTGFGEYMGAMASEGWWNTLAGQARAQVRQAKGGEADPRKLTREDWQASEWQREGLDWYEGLTAGQARVRAEVFDENAYRRWVIGQRDAGVIGMAAGIGAMLVGSLPTPENLIPIGPAYHAAKVARFGLAMRRGAVVGGLAGLAGTAAFAPPVYYSASQFGDDIGWADVMLDLSLGTALGAGLGAGSAAMRHWATRSPRQPTMNTPDTQTALDAMGLAGQDIAAGRSVDVAASADVRAAIRDAALRHASPEVRANAEAARAASADIDRIIAEENARMNRDAAAMQEADQAATWGNDPTRPANENAEPPIAGFQTARGSTYEVAGDGTTTRNKAARNDAGHEGDSGPKPQSARTVYVDGDASGLSAAGLHGLGSKGARVVIKDGKASLLTWNEKGGKWGRSPEGTDIPVHDTPAVGRSPLELWKPTDDVPGWEAYSGMHAGNPIVSVTRRSPAPSESAARERASGSEYASRSPADPDLEPLAPLPANDDLGLDPLDQETFDRFVAELEERGDIPDDIRAELEEAAEFERQAATARETYERAAYCALGG